MKNSVEVYLYVLTGDKLLPFSPVDFSALPRVGDRVSLGGEGHLVVQVDWAQVDGGPRPLFCPLITLKRLEEVDKTPKPDFSGLHIVPDPD